LRKGTEVKITFLKLGITQQQIADECGVSKSLVSMVINGTRKNEVVSKCIKKTIQVREAENALRSSEGKYRKLIKNLPVGIEEIDEDGRITYVNPAFARILGLNNSDIIGQYIWDNSANEKEKEKVKQTFLNIISGKEKRKIIETKAKVTGEKVIDLEVRWNKKINEDDTITLTSIIIDITERKKYREKIEKSRSNFMNIFASNPIPSVIFKRKDKDFIIEAFNDASFKNTKKKIDKYKGKKLSTLFEQGHFFRKLLNKCYLTEKNITKEDWFVSPFTDRRLFIEFNAVYFEPDMVIVYMHNKTDEKIHLDSLESLSSRLQTSLGSSNSFWIEIYTKEKKIIVDKSLSDYLEYDEKIEEIGFDELSRFVFEDDFYFVNKKLEALINGKIDNIDIDFRIKKQSMDYRWFNLIGAVYTADKRRKKYKFSGIFKDISSRKVEELERLKLNMELESFNRTLTHDIRTPLTIIAGYSEILLSELSSEVSDEYKGYLKAIYSNCERLQRLTESLKKLSRVRRKTIIPQEINLRDMVKKIVCDLKVIYKEHDIKLKMSDNVRLKADPELMEIVFNNLIENSIKYCCDDKRPCIEIGVIKSDSPHDEKKDILFLKDNGVGFDNKYAKDIFKEFIRVDNSHKSGNGIGLAIVKKAVEKMDGYIWAESEVGVGTSFFILI